MTPITINVDSWHYRMLHKFNASRLWGCRDLCTYTRAVVLTALMLGIISSLSMFTVGAILGDAIAWILACIVTSTWIEPGMGIIFVIATCILVLMFVAAAQFHEWRENRRYDVKEPSTLMLAYRSWKDKYCTKIKFSDE